MNTKRQTVWLVSMLSLMVVLSAYYLFTDDVNQMEMTTEELNMSDITATEVDNAEGDQTEAVGSEITAEDEQVLQQVQAQASSAEDFFIGLELKRNESLAMQFEQLQTIIAESESAEAVAKAHEEMRNLEEKEAKITALEEQLARDFANVMVAEESNKFKILVQAEKLERSQAVSIVDMVMKEMSVGPDKIVVQRISD
jgi:stage III sporulation protein AH